MKQKRASPVQLQDRKEVFQELSSSEEKNPHSVCSVSLYWRWDLRHWKCQWQKHVTPQNSNATVDEWGSKLVVGSCGFKDKIYSFCKRTKSNSELSH